REQFFTVVHCRAAASLSMTRDSGDAMHLVPVRYAAMIAVVAIFVFSLIVTLSFDSGWWWLALLSGALTVRGIMDMRQKNHALLRNYPLLAHFRYLFESIRPEIRQYFLEEDAASNPFSRNQRSLVYQ